MRIARLIGLSCLLVWGSVSVGSLAQDEGRPPVTRAKRPKFPQRDVDSTYFKNVFKEALVGDRPALGRPTGAVTGNGDGNPMNSTDAPGNSTWATWISADVLENEIKSLKQAADQNITTPVKFAGGGYQDARRDFSELAMLFAIIHEFNGDVRWQSDAASLRDAFARSAGNAKTGSQQAYNEAKQRKQDLQDIVGGNAFVGTKTTDPDNDWSRICDRSPLMERLQLSIDLIKPAIANEREFESQAELLRHEASLVAAMGVVLTLEGMEDAIEEDYTKFAIQMRDGGAAIVGAVKNSSYEKAVESVGAIDKACSNCHDDWR